jgi:excisionase family DNA binding protein
MDKTPFLTIQQVAEYLNIKVKTIYAMVPDMPHYKIGRLVRFRKDEIDRWMESNKREAVEAPKVERPLYRRPASPDSIVRRAIDEVMGSGYTSSGKSDRIKGL